MTIKFECTELNKNIEVNYSGIVFVQATGHTPSVLDNEISIIKTKMLDCVYSSGLDVELLGKIVNNGLVDLVTKYHLGDSDTKRIHKILLAEMNELITFYL